MSNKVTVTGRAISPGFTTRTTLSVRKRGRRQERPLSFNLQCHPKALVRTPVHPGCVKNNRQYGLAVAMMARFKDRSYIKRGVELSHVRPTSGTYYSLESPEYGIVGYTHDIMRALGFKYAADHKFGLPVNVIEETI